MCRKKIALGCPTNDVLDFPIHFHPPIFRYLEENGVFQQPQAIALIDNWRRSDARAEGERALDVPGPPLDCESNRDYFSVELGQLEPKEVFPIIGLQIFQDLDSNSLAQ